MKKDQRKDEQEAVRTTIVGGRPAGSGKPVGNIPRGIEVLVKKASVDSKFKALLLAKRDEAAKEIDLQLDSDEAMLLSAIPVEQLEAIIAKTHVPAGSRAAFLGKVAAVMLVALTAVAACDKPTSMGVTADAPDDSSGMTETATEDPADGQDDPDQPTAAPDEDEDDTRPPSGLRGSSRGVRW